MITKALSSIYKVIVQARHKIYSSNIKTTYSLDVPVIVVGNITAGGTGKTPFVDYVLNVIKSKNLAAGVISRGYGGDYTGVTCVDLDSEAAAVKFGDEPMLLKQKHMDVPVYLSASRYKAGLELLQDHENIKAIVCDDGFQHFALKRDFNIVLIDCTAGSESYQMLPHGRLREPLQGLERADFIVFTKCNWALPEQVNACKKLIGEHFVLNKTNCAFAEYKSKFPKLDNNKVLLVSSIAKPDVFEKNVKETSLYEVQGHLVYKDHHNYSEKDITDIIQDFNYSKCDWILTTEKDLVKLNQFDKLKGKIKTVNITVDLISGKESFKRELFKVLN